MADISFKEVATAIRAALVPMAATVPQTNVLRGTGTTAKVFPIIRMHQQANAEDISTMGRRLFQVFYVSVIAVAKNNASSADDISVAFDALLERGSLNIGTAQHNTTVRIGRVWYEEFADDGAVYTHSGGIYRIGVKQL